MRFINSILLGTMLVCVEARGEFELSNGIAAIADDAVITVQEVRQASALTIETYRRTFNNPEAFERKSLEALADALEGLIDRQLILHDFKNLGGIIQESYIDDRIKERIREQFGDRMTLIKGLHAQGITWETFRQRERDRVIESIMESKNVREGLLISPAKIEHHYRTNLLSYKLGNRVKLRMIELKCSPAGSADDVQGLASEVKTKIDQGTTFAEMAAAYSQGLYSKEGGLWGWKQESDWIKGLSEIAFGLKTGQCSRVVSFARAGDDAYWIYQYDEAGKIVLGRKFSDGHALLEERKFENQAGHAGLPEQPSIFYLMTVDEKQSARTRTLAELRDEIERDLLLQERARLQRKWLQRLRAKSFFRYF